MLSVTSRDEIRTVNRLKNLLATAVSLTTLILFVALGLVRWPETLAMLVGTFAGGALGGRLIAVLPPRLVRMLVTLLGLAMTAIYAWRYWS